LYSDRCDRRKTGSSEKSCCFLTGGEKLSTQGFSEYMCSRRALASAGLRLLPSNQPISSRTRWWGAPGNTAPRLLHPAGQAGSLHLPSCTRPGQRPQPLALSPSLLEPLSASCMSSVEASRGRDQEWLSLVGQESHPRHTAPEEVRVPHAGWLSNLS